MASWGASRRDAVRALPERFLPRKEPRTGHNRVVLEEPDCLESVKRRSAPPGAFCVPLPPAAGGTPHAKATPRFQMASAVRADGPPRPSRGLRRGRPGRRTSRRSTCSGNPMMQETKLELLRSETRERQNQIKEARERAKELRELARAPKACPGPEGRAQARRRGPGSCGGVRPVAAPSPMAPRARSSLRSTPRRTTRPPTPRRRPGRAEHRIPGSERAVRLERRPGVQPDAAGRPGLRLHRERRRDLDRRRHPAQAGRRSRPGRATPSSP